MLTRVLDQFAVEGEADDRKLESLRIVLHLGLMTELLHHIDGPYAWILLLSVALGSGVAWGARRPRLGTAVVASTASAWAWMRFPGTANHIFLMTGLLWLLVFLDTQRGSERRLGLQWLRAYTAVFIAWTGLQKMLYGHWFDGHYPAYLIAKLPNYATGYGWLLSDADIQRLTAVDLQTPGSGPLHVDSSLFVALSNAVWAAELLVPLLLCFRRTRTLGLLGGIGMMLGIQWFAREGVFGTVAVSLFLLYARRDWIRSALPVFVILYLTMLAARHAGWPPITFY